MMDVHPRPKLRCPCLVAKLARNQVWSARAHPKPTLWLQSSSPSKPDYFRMLEVGDPEGREAAGVDDMILCIVFSSCGVNRLRPLRSRSITDRGTVARTRSRSYHNIVGAAFAVLVPHM